MASPVRAAGIDPATIDRRITLAGDAELLLRRRPPSEVELRSGHREHLLMCTLGMPLDQRPVFSRLSSPEGVREWRSCPAGQITFIPAGFPIQWEWSCRSESVHLALAPDSLARLTSGLERRPGRPEDLRPVFREFDEPLAQLLHALRREACGSDLGSDLMTSSLLTALGVQLLRLADGGRWGSAQRKAPGLSVAQQRRALELINDRLCESLPLSELAAEFDLSPFHFARLFKRATGLPPHECQPQLRIKSACESLRAQPQRTVADIASDLGFADENHLRRHFKRMIGITPSAYRSRQ